MKMALSKKGRRLTAPAFVADGRGNQAAFFASLAAV